MEQYTRRKRQIHSNEEGYVLVLAMVLVLVISLIAVAGTSTSVGGKWRSSNYLSTKQALYSAEAGIQDAVARLIAGTISDTGSENDPVWNSGSTYNSVAGDFTNTFTVVHLVNGGSVVKDLGGLPYYVIQSTGYEGASKSAQKTIRSVISLRRDYVFSGAMTGCRGVSASGRASVDSYDSANGPYTSETARANGSLETCEAGSDISLSGNPSIKGNVSATGTVTISGSPTVIGTVKNGAATSDCDPIDVDDYVESKRPAGTPTVVSLNNADSLTVTAPGTFYYSSVNLSGGTLTITAPAGPPRNATMFINGDLTVTSDSNFNIGSNVRLTIYVKGKVALSGQGVTNQGPPTSLILYSSNTGTDAVSVTGGADFYGAIYAPLGNVSLSGTSSFFGAVRGKTVSDSGTADFHYDEELGKMPIGGIQGYTMVNWKEIFN